MCAEQKTHARHSQGVPRDMLHPAELAGVVWDWDKFPPPNNWNFQVNKGGPCFWGRRGSTIPQSWKRSVKSGPGSGSG